MKNDLVNIFHPETGGTHQCPQSAFDIVWSKKGWQIVGDNTEVSTSEEGATPLAELTKAKLLAIAEGLGVEVNKRWNKERIAEAIEAYNTETLSENDTNQGNEPDDAQEG